MYPTASLFMLICTFAQLAFTQEKEYLDRHQSPTTAEKAVYYRICQRDNMKRMQGKVKVYRITGSLYSELTYIDGLRDGFYAAYHPNGNLAMKGRYEVDKRLGLWEYWYDNHQKQKEENYLDNGTLKIESYWDRNGKQLLKNGTGFYEYIDELEVTSEKGFFKNYERDGAWVGYFEDGKLYFQEEWAAGKLLKGVSHDEQGTIYTYTEAEYHTLPQFEGGIPAMVKYLQKNLKYPKDAQRAGIEGKISVKFMVSNEGKISDVAVINSNSYLDNEAMRIVSNMPDWRPALLRGQKIDAPFVVPIMFKLN